MSKDKYKKLIERILWDIIVVVLILVGTVLNSFGSGFGLIMVLLAFLIYTYALALDK